MLKFFKELRDAMWDSSSQETQQINADIKTLSALFKKHFDLTASACKPHIQSRDVEAMGGIDLTLGNTSLSIEAFEEKLAEVKLTPYLQYHRTHCRITSPVKWRHLKSFELFDAIFS